MPILTFAAWITLAMSNDYSESLRPKFHFTAKSGWLNDPNGLVFYKGTYHLFFQHNPFGNEWGHMTWGHATSPDLVHWTQQSNAIEPDSLGTIFSGSAVVNATNSTGFKSGAAPALVAAYACAGDTSPESKGKPFTQCLAYSQDAGITWKKYVANPVLPQIEPGNRDPKVLWYEPKREWVMALYLTGDEFCLLTSNDLKKWSILQRFHFQGAGECPDFFEMPIANASGTKWVFTSASGRYMVGTFDGNRFTPEQSPQNMDLGPNFYAVQTYSGIPKRDGRRIQIAWMNGGKYPGMPFNQQMSFPCRLTLHRDGAEYRIHRQPVNEIRELYQERSSLRNVDLGSKNSLSSLSGDLWDASFDIDVREAKKIDLSFQGVTASIDVGRQELACDGRTAPITISNGRFKVRALIDRTSYELFGNDGALSFSGCFLPRPGAAPMSLTAEGGSAIARSITVYSLHSSWR